MHNISSIPKDTQYAVDRVEIFLPHSQTAEIYKEYSLPASMISFVNGELSLIQMYRNLKSEDERLSHKSVSFCLEELYREMSTKVLIKELFLPHQDEYLNADTLGIVSETELNIFLRDIVGSDNVYITHMTVIDSNGLDEIIDNFKVLELVNTKTYLYNIDIENMIESLNVIADTKSIIQIEAFLCFIVITALFFFYKNNRKDKKKALLFYQYGYNKKEIILNSTRKIESYLVFLSTTIINCGIAFFIYKSKSINSISVIVHLLVVTVISFIVVKSDIFLKKKAIKKSFSWRWR